MTYTRTVSGRTCFVTLGKSCSHLGFGFLFSKIKEWDPKLLKTHFGEKILNSASPKSITDFAKAPRREMCFQNLWLQQKKAPVTSLSISWRSSQLGL